MKLVFKAIPKGYFQTEFPLPHNINYTGQFGLETTASNATYLPIILNDEALVNADAVNVNPEHGSFAEADHAYCHKNSIIPRINFTLRVQLTKAAVETDAVRAVRFSFMPVYTSFLNRLEAEDSKTAVQIEDILELEHETTGKSCYPLWGAVNLLSGGTVELHATPTTALMGLTGDAVHENIVFDKELFFDALQYYTNAPMLRKVTGRMKTVTITRDRPFIYHSNNYANPMIKRINPYTFCGVLLYSPLVTNTSESLIRAGDTTNVSHIDFNSHIRYDEWNPHFDQTPS